MDEETKAHLELMESRLMTRLDGLQEQMLERFHGVETNLRGVETHLRGVAITLNAHTELMRSNNTLLTMLVTGHGDHGRRITDLEKK